MGFLKRIFSRDTGPQHIGLPDNIPATEVAALHVHTAENLVVISTGVDGARVIIDAARTSTAQQLRSGDARPVNLIPLEHGNSVPALDPKLGWLIPVSPDTAAELLKIAGPGEYELASLNLAVVVE